jgi:hypothetical protein
MGTGATPGPAARGRRPAGQGKLGALDHRGPPQQAADAAHVMSGLLSSLAAPTPHPHLLEPELLDARLVGRDGSALDAHAALLQGARRGVLSPNPKARQLGSREPSAAAYVPCCACSSVQRLARPKLRANSGSGCSRALWTGLPSQSPTPPPVAHQDGLGRVHRDLVVGGVPAIGASVSPNSNA